ncbi:Anoctamin-7 [Quaeritorhiza haematococci]|nr:Anoctamin-7 [Quaeritorhiza haematococci]
MDPLVVRQAMAIAAAVASGQNIETLPSTAQIMVQNATIRRSSSNHHPSIAVSQQQLPAPVTAPLSAVAGTPTGVMVGTTPTSASPISPTKTAILVGNVTGTSSDGANSGPTGGPRDASERGDVVAASASEKPPNSPPSTRSPPAARAPPARVPPPPQRPPPQRPPVQRPPPIGTGGGAGGSAIGIKKTTPASGGVSYAGRPSSLASPTSTPHLTHPKPIHANSVAVMGGGAGSPLRKSAASLLSPSVLLQKTSFPASSTALVVQQRELMDEKTDSLVGGMVLHRRPRAKVTRSADAIVKMVYGPPRYDFILKYQMNGETSSLRPQKPDPSPSPSQSPQPYTINEGATVNNNTDGGPGGAFPSGKKNHQTWRDAFELKMLHLGFLLEYEQSVERSDEVFVKIITPFWLLCAAAEKVKLRLPLKRPKHPIPLDAYRRKNSTFMRRLLTVIEDPVDLDWQTARFRVDQLHRFRGGFESVSTSEGPGAGAGGEPLHSIQLRFFKQTHRALLSYHLISCLEINIDGVQNQNKPRLEGIDFLLFKSVYTDFFHVHDTDTDFPLRPSFTKLTDMNNNSQFNRAPQSPVGGMMGTTTSPTSPTATKVVPIPPSLRARLVKEWVKRRPWTPQPLDDVREYFGEKAALYFAFFGYYTSWLFVSAVFGIAVVVVGFAEVMQTKEGQPRQWRKLIDNAFTPWYGFIMSLWATLFLEFWKRRNNYLAYVWATNDFESVQHRRFEFKPNIVRRSLVTGKLEPHFPAASRWLRQFITGIVIMVSIVIIVGSVVAQIIFNVWIKYALSLPTTSKDPFYGLATSKDVASILSSLVGLLSVLVLRQTYIPVAVALNRWENYRTDTQFEDAMILKRWIFELININARMFYYVDLFYQLLFIFLGDLIIGRSQETRQKKSERHWFWRKKAKEVYPSPLGSPLEAIQSGSATGSPAEQSTMQQQQQQHVGLHEQHYHDEKLPLYDGFLIDYLAKVIQFSYVTIFVTAFPIGPFFAWINNVIELRGDALKLLLMHQRLIPERAQDIGIWFTILRFVAVIAVTTNATLVAFMSNFFEETWLASITSDTTNWLPLRLAFIMIWHGVIHVVCFLVAYMIPDVPYLVRVARARQRYLENAEKDGDDDDDDGSLSGIVTI